MKKDHDDSLNSLSSIKEVISEVLHQFIRYIDFTHRLTVNVEKIIENVSAQLNNFSRITNIVFNGASLETDKSNKNSENKTLDQKKLNNKKLIIN